MRSSAQRRPGRWPLRIAAPSRIAIAAGCALALSGAAVASVRDGDRALSAGRLEEAMKEYEESARQGNAAADRFFWLGTFLDRQKRTADAERAFRKSIELDHSGPMAGPSYRQLGHYRLARQQWSAAIPLLERAVAVDSEDAQSWRWLGQAQQNSGNRSKAAESYRRTLELIPATRLPGGGSLGASS